MACLGEIDVIVRLISADASDGTNTLSLEGIAAEVAFDGTSHAFMKWTGDPLVQVDTETGDVDGLISMKDVPVFVDNVSISPDEVTREYCVCNGLCYIDEESA